jgi:hypothetical protein
MYETKTQKFTNGEINMKQRGLRGSTLQKKTHVEQQRSGATDVV